MTKKEKIDLKDYIVEKEESMPREKMIENGPKSLKDWELLAILLRTGTKDTNVLELSKGLLEYGGGTLSELVKLDYHRLAELKGFGEQKITTLLATFEISNRVTRERSFDAFKDMSSVRNASEYIMTKMQNFTEEHFMVLILNNKNKLINKSLTRLNEDGISETDSKLKREFILQEKKFQYMGEDFVSKGTVDRTIAMPREVFRKAVRMGASSIILAHNHPSGDPTPSHDDINITKRLVESGHILGIEVLDHIVVAKGLYYSLKEHGDM